MRILPEIHSLTFNTIDLKDAKYTLLNINENNVISYKHTNKSNDLILQDLLEGKAYATTLLYLNENYNLEVGKFKDMFNESFNANDYYADCEDLLSKNIKIVETAGIPLTNINGYNIFESDKGIVRGNGCKKIYENFNTINIEDITLDLLKSDYTDAFINDYVVCPECNAIFNVVENSEEDTVQDVEMYSTLDNPAAEKVVNYDISKTTCPYCKYSAETEEFYQASLDDIQSAPNAEELIPGSTSINEEAEGTQTTDIAPKVDQNMSNITTAKPKKKYYDILLSDIDENADEILNKGFMKNKDGHYQRGNYVLVKENDKYIAIRKDKIKF